MSHANALNTPGKWIVSFSLFECGIIHDANLTFFFMNKKLFYDTIELYFLIFL